MKTSVKKLNFLKGYPSYDLVEAILWKDDEDDELTVEINSPTNGFYQSKDIVNLIKFLEVCANRMDKNNQ